MVAAPVIRRVADDEAAGVEPGAIVAVVGLQPLDRPIAHHEGQLLLDLGGVGIRRGCGKQGNGQGVHLSLPLRLAR